jgi:hypothetical protein
MRRSFFQKQIPTLLGISLLVVGLIVGVLFIGSGGSLNFAPRAAPQTTPKLVKVTNVGDTSFTVSFLTDEVSNGFVKYGTDANNLNKQASDDRDQLTGSVGQYTTHHITVRNLQPNTQYFYTLGTVSVPKFDNNGSPFTTKTGPKLGNTPAAKTAYGTVTGTGIDGAIIYLQIAGAGELSTLVKNSSSWAIPLSTARTSDGSKYATIDPNGDATVTAQGQQVTNVIKIPAKVSELQPLPPITLTGSGTTSTDTSTNAMTTAVANNQGPNNANSAAMSSINSGMNNTPAETAVMNGPSTTNTAVLPSLSPTATSSDLTTADMTTLPPTSALDTSTAQNPVVDVKEKGNIIVDDTQPTIVGTAPANATVSIVIHSSEAIAATAQADANGKYTVDLESLGKNLEPGQHTVTVTYKNAQGKTVTETKKFTVAETAKPAAQTPSTTSLNTSATSDSTLLALATGTPQPYGTSNPYTIPSPTATPIPVISTPTPSPVATRSAVPVTGAVENTIALLIGGGLLIGVGILTSTKARQKSL